MTLHQVEYAYMVPEWSAIDLDMDDTLDLAEKEAIALAEIKEIYDDISDIEILKIKVVD
jgi:hypothetical protein